MTAIEPVDFSCALEPPEPRPLSRSHHHQWTPKHCKNTNSVKSTATQHSQSLSAVSFIHLSNTPESSAALITHPIKRTPARTLMFFRGMPLLPPRARIRAAMCLRSSLLIFLRFGLDLCLRSLSLHCRLLLNAAISVANQLISPSCTDNKQTHKSRSELRYVASIQKQFVVVVVFVGVLRQLASIVLHYCHLLSHFDLIYLN